MKRLGMFLGGNFECFYSVMNVYFDFELILFLTEWLTEVLTERAECTHSMYFVLTFISM